MKRKVLKKAAIISLAVFNISACSSPSVIDSRKDTGNAESSKEENNKKSLSSSENLSKENLSVTDASNSANEQLDAKYKDFLDNKENIHFEECTFLNVDCDRYLDKEKGYTLNELVETVKRNTSRYDESKGKEEITSSAIDCGNDGQKELIVKIRFPGAEDEEYDTPYQSYNQKIVIKDVDGKLMACFYAEDNNYTSTNINEYGYVETSSRGYLSVVADECGYLDANASWHLYYHYRYYLDMNSYINEVTNYRRELGITDMNFSDEWKGFQVEEYIFGDKFTKDNTCTIYYKTDDNGVDKNPEIYEDGSLYKKKFDEYNIKTYSPEGLSEALKERRKEIGLDDSIIITKKNDSNQNTTDSDSKDSKESGSAQNAEGIQKISVDSLENEFTKAIDTVIDDNYTLQSYVFDLDCNGLKEAIVVEGAEDDYVNQIIEGADCFSVKRVWYVDENKKVSELTEYAGKFLCHNQEIMKVDGRNYLTLNGYEGINGKGNVYTLNNGELVKATGDRVFFGGQKKFETNGDISWIIEDYRNCCDKEKGIKVKDGNMTGHSYLPYSMHLVGDKFELYNGKEISKDEAIKKASLDLTDLEGKNVVDVQFIIRDNNRLDVNYVTEEDKFYLFFAKSFVISKNGTSWEQIREDKGYFDINPDNKEYWKFLDKTM